MWPFYPAGLLGDVYSAIYSHFVATAYHLIGSGVVFPTFAFAWPLILHLHRFSAYPLLTFLVRAL